MEHIGCVLQSDFIDFYDHELGATTCSHALSLVRYQNKRLPIQSQMQHLSDAQILHCMALPLSDMFGILKQFGNELSTTKEFLDMMLLVVYDDVGTPTLCSYLQAQQMDPSRFAMHYQPTLISGSRVLTYIQIGSLSLWVRRESQDNWRSGHGNCKVETVSVCKHLNPKQLRHLPHAIFSIDFLQLKGRMDAINYDIAPNLGKLGVSQTFSAKEVANAIMDRLDNAERPEPDCADDVQDTQ